MLSTAGILNGDSGAALAADRAQITAAGQDFVGDAQDVSGNNIPLGGGAFVGDATTVEGATSVPGVAHGTIPVDGTATDGGTTGDGSQVAGNGGQGTAGTGGQSDGDDAAAAAHGTIVAHSAAVGDDGDAPVAAAHGNGAAAAAHATTYIATLLQALQQNDSRTFNDTDIAGSEVHAASAADPNVQPAFTYHFEHMWG